MSVIYTYAKALDAEIVALPEKSGLTDISALADLSPDSLACVYIETPNYYGLIEDGAAAADAAHGKGAKLIAGVNPISLAVFAAPSEYGADIAVGEGQPLGMPLSFGGPYLGFMAARKELLRKLPGRIVGQTTDTDGKRAFVLTLQAREQHIRREKALSNICSNQALCALTATIYCAAMGPEGLKSVAEQCMANADYLKKELASVGFESVHTGERFHEFVTDCPVPAKPLLKALAKSGILGGLCLPENKLLWCATEATTKQDIDFLISCVKRETEKTDSVRRSAGGASV
jgi:glycine dehydrogenase subunit 1